MLVWFLEQLAKAGTNLAFQALIKNLHREYISSVRVCIQQRINKEQCESTLVLVEDVLGDFLEKYGGYMSFPQKFGVCKHSRFVLDSILLISCFVRICFVERFIPIIQAIWKRN